MKRKNLNTINNKLKGVMKIIEIDYIFLTDLKKYKNYNNTSNAINNKQMTNNNSFDFYSLWKELFNKNFGGI